ncbi:MAG: Vacuolar H+transporting two-sector ATPase F subunit [Betaproteobacteria bacterium]|nr:Vacuolar H+transporting two-sector ATPase F subunit [Betaproteobacteria bacterium]PWB62509.1 MAG: Vacuolar H+transporting two-sector ATPase F subunit [Betaproteobacteria bacterium]
MASLVFIGDEVAAAGWRLAGVEARAAMPGAEGAQLAKALEEAQLVLVSAEAAARIPEADLRAALRRLTPVTVVVPDLREAVRYPDVAARMKRQLGIES